LRRCSLFSSAFLFFSNSRRRFSKVFRFFAMGSRVDVLVRRCACPPSGSFTTRLFCIPGQRSCRQWAEESTARRHRFSTGGPDRLVRHRSRRDSRAVWPRSP
jgi:hypothetical protein